MKFTLITALIISSVTACTNNSRTTRTEEIKDDNKTVKIEDDGKVLSMKVSIRNTEQPIDFDESFDIRDMNEKQIKKLETHILDSLYQIK